VFEQRFYLEGLAHASYLIGSDGEAAVVDPRRDVDDYLAAAQAQGFRIVAVLETHPHADFVSGHVELARRTGAKIYASHLARAAYEHVPVREGDTIRVGELKIDVIETPGHSPDSVTYLVRENDRIVSLFTGDTLFVGDVGRPDLRDARTAGAWGGVAVWAQYLASAIKHAGRGAPDELGAATDRPRGVCEENARERAGSAVVFRA